MSDRSLSILNIGIDRDLLSQSENTEARIRQSYYAANIPARIVHIVKAPHGWTSEPLVAGDGLLVIPCPVRHWSLFIPAAIKIGHDLLKHGSFDIVNVQEPFVCGLAGAWISRRFRLPLVVGLYSDEIDNPTWLSENPINLCANHVGKWVLRQASAVRCDSEAVAKRVKRYGFNNVVHIPFLITQADKLLKKDPKAEKLRQKLLGNKTGPLLIAVCRLEAEKNISLMLNAFSRALERCPSMVLAIIGTGQLAEALRQEAERLRTLPVRWLGWIDNADMPPFYQAADLTMLSSDRESAARVLYESLLARTPVLTTDTAGAREVVKDGVTGRIVPIGDCDKFAEAIVNLCSNPAKLREMGEKGSSQMATHVTASAIVGKMRCLYDQAIQESHESSRL